MVRSYMKWSFILDLEYVCPRQDNPWAGCRSHSTGNVSVAMPADDWFCSKIQQMNLHLLQGHVTRTGDRNWLQFDQFFYPSLDPSVFQPGKSVNIWSGEMSPLNSSFTRIS